MTKRFFLVRHGATERPGVLLGQYDAALSDEGVRQAREMTRQLAGERIERIVSSALARARQTAGILSARLGISCESDAALNEISYGRWDGLTWEQIERLDPLAAQRKLQDWWSAAPEGGESAAVFARRVEQAWGTLLVHPARATVVVAHEAVSAVLNDLARQRIGGDNREWQPDWKYISSFRQELGSCGRLSVEVE